MYGPGLLVGPALPADADEESEETQTGGPNNTSLSSLQSEKLRGGLSL